MHKELKLKTRSVKQQALIANKRGQKMEVFAKNLQKCAPILADYGYELEEYALLVQYHAQHSLMYALLQEQGLYSQDLLLEATRAHL